MVLSFPRSGSQALQARRKPMSTQESMSSTAMQCRYLLASLLQKNLISPMLSTYI